MLCTLLKQSTFVAITTVEVMCPSKVTPETLEAGMTKGEKKENKVHRCVLQMTRSRSVPFCSTVRFSSRLLRFLKITGQFLNVSLLESHVVKYNVLFSHFISSYLSLLCSWFLISESTSEMHDHIHHSDFRVTDTKYPGPAVHNTNRMALHSSF
jgi:hypothetical protein